jgi:hypothetical protein
MTAFQNSGTNSIEFFGRNASELGIFFEGF